MRKTREKMTVVKFNRHLHKIQYNSKSCKIIYDYSIEVIRLYLMHRFGKKDFIEDTVHDVFWYKIYLAPPQVYIVSPVSWICKIAKNYTLSMLKLKENTTVELVEDIVYLPELESNILFLDKEFEREWVKVDGLTREIILLNAVHKYHLYEIAEMLGLSYCSVRTRVSRAKKFLQNSVTKRRPE